MIGGRTSLKKCDAHLCAFGAHSVRTFTDVDGSFRLFFTASPTTLPTALLTAPHRGRCASSPLDIQFLTDDLLLICFDDILTVSIPHRPSPPFTDLHRHCSPLFHSVRFRCAYSPPLYSVRMRIAIVHRPSPTFTNLHRHCVPPFYSVRMRSATSGAHSVHIPHQCRWKFYPLSVKVRTECAQMRTACPHSYLNHLYSHLTTMKDHLMEPVIRSGAVPGEMVF